MNRVLFWNKKKLCLGHNNSLLPIVKGSYTIGFVWNKGQPAKDMIYARNETSLIGTSRTPGCMICSFHLELSLYSCENSASSCVKYGEVHRSLVTRHPAVNVLVRQKKIAKQLKQSVQCKRQKVSKCVHNVVQNRSVNNIEYSSRYNRSFTRRQRSKNKLDAYKKKEIKLSKHSISSP